VERARIELALSGGPKADEEEEEEIAVEDVDTRELGLMPIFRRLAETPGFYASDEQLIRDVEAVVDRIHERFAPAAREHDTLIRFMRMLRDALGESAVG
jgi:hypothetical protein